MIDKEIPDFIKNAGPHVIKLYDSYLDLDEQLQNHPKRLQVVESIEGETITVDMLGVWGMIEQKCKKFNIPKDEVIRLKKLSKEFYQLKALKANAKKRWFRELHSGNKPLTPLEIKRKDLLNLFASFYTPNEVKEIFYKDYGFKCKIESLNRFFYDNRKEIERLQKEKISSNQNLRIARETGRLEILSEIHFYYYRRWQKDRNPSDSKMCMFILEQARKEVKGNEVKLTIDGKIDINTTIHAQSNINKLLPRLNLNILVVALTAHKNGLNSLALMDDLINGYYSKYTGFASEPPKEIKSDEIIYPSTFIRSYDWTKIDQLHAEREKQKKILAGIETETKEEERLTKKETLLRYLNDLKDKNS